MAETGSIRDRVLDDLAAARDSLSVRRVFGDPYELDGATVIPVAAVRGVGGGGGGEGTGPEGEGTGSGAGTGFAVSARPLGVYVLRGGSVEWLPSVDVSRLALTGMAVAALAVLSLRRVLVKRS